MPVINDTHCTLVSGKAGGRANRLLLHPFFTDHQQFTHV